MSHTHQGNVLISVQVVCLGLLDFDLSGADLEAVGPVAFLVPSYMPLVSPETPDLCILSQRFRVCF